MAPKSLKPEKTSLKELNFRKVTSEEVMKLKIFLVCTGRRIYLQLDSFSFLSLAKEYLKQ